MKILIITLEYPPQVGGIASYVGNFASHVPPESTIVYAPKVKGGAEWDKLNPWKTYRRNPYWAFVWPRWIRMFWHIWAIARRENISAIYLHNILPVGYVAYLIKKFKKVPYVIFLHGTDVSVATKTIFRRKKFKLICREAQEIVVNSNFLKEKLKERVENWEAVKVLYPCPADFFLVKQPEESLKKLRAQLALEGKKVIITVARMVEGKGYPHLARLLPQILEKIPNLVWLMVGDGPKREIILDLIHKNSLQNVVRYLGAIPQTDLPQYYQVADLFVLLTHPDESREEGWGTVFLEAAASGLPVVAGRSGGTAEAVEDGVTGFIVDIYQEKNVVETITRLLLESEYAKQMGQTGMERIRKEFKWEDQIKKLKNYETIT